LTVAILNLKKIEYFLFDSKYQNTNCELISSNGRTKCGISESNYKYPENEEFERKPDILKIKYILQIQGCEYFFIKDILDEIFDNPDMKIFFVKSIPKGFISIISCKPETKRFFNKQN
jgi:hypothetical protein